MFLREREAIWKDLVDFRYDKMEKEVFNKISPKSLRMTFIWWRDLTCLDSNASYLVDWLVSNILCKLRNGKRILFWWNNWYGEQPLCLEFPDVFKNSEFKFATVSELGSWGNIDLCWNLSLFSVSDQLYVPQLLSFQQELSSLGLYR